MIEPGPLTVKMRRICLELARVRGERGLTQKDVERLLGIPSSTLSRIESCERAVRRDDLSALLAIYQVARPVREAVLELHREANLPSLLEEADLHVHDELATWVGFEEHAVEIRNYEHFLVPGLCQTEDYARAVIENYGLPLERSEVHRRVAARIARQGLLRREGGPRLNVLLHEAALWQDVGGPDVMREQLRHLAALADRPGIEVRIVPGGVGAHPGLVEGAFVILDFVGLPSLVHIEHMVHSLYLEEKPDANAYKAAFNGILAVAHGARDSVDLIRKLGEGL
ncbi:helix-turn-helix domain-containing protein [Saccharothrix coeruleofusca]|uniref:Transcriptional regulator n=1 Tax=Saccharothrix coeruleofusca TaxID=33919 RepID=A0A918AWC8_9PSEU|nr:helix-turn-helix transcriptional regulator [Saccharothrix coeruleofusca]GGP86590.1 transcriptional regulator [Saccharothrix coeruleofusca]